MAKKKNIPVNYTSRDFDTIKSDLVNIATRYYPDTFQDFNEASFGAMMLDTVAYVGDILSFYLDYQANESFLDTAVEYDNLLKLGKQIGFKFEQTPASHGLVDLFILVPAAATGLGPDSAYIPILRRGAEFESVDGVLFSLVENVNFADSTNEIVVAEVDSTTGIPTQYAIKAQGTVVSGQISSEQITIGAYQKFLSVNLSDGSNITEIVSVYDSEGNRYYEVDYLSQNVVYKEILNKGADNEQVKSLMKPMIVPRRFVVDQSLGDTTLQFGYGSEATTTSKVVSDPSSVVLKQHGKDYTSDSSFDPSKLIETDKFGIAPANTTLEVFYRYNTAGNVNVFTGMLTIVGSRSYIFPNEDAINASKRGDVVTSLEVSNPEPIVGDITFPNTTELKQRILATNASQNRAVTREDYINLCYRMPAKFGKVKRVNIIQDNDSFKRNLNLYVLSESPNGNYAPATDTLKQNLKVWLNKNRMINDTVDILDGKVVNLGIKYVVRSDSFSNPKDLMTLINSILAKYIDDHKYDIGEPFSISTIFKVIGSVTGVEDIVTIKVEQKTGSIYSDVLFDIDAATSADGRVIYAPENVAFEIASTDADIEGTVR
tara:strand:+ start:1402 stop:3204 length:1803 start_codon:yes stop_codon:yes gene_type:complete